MDDNIVFVYRDILLPFSNTFINDHVCELRKFRPILIGTNQSRPNIIPPNIQVVTADSAFPYGRAASFLHKVAAYSSSIAGAFCRLRPRLVHAHFGVDAMYILPYARRYGVPMVVTFHGIDATAVFSESHQGYSMKRLRAGKDVLFSYCKKIFVVSDFIAKNVIKLGADPDKVCRHYLGTRLPEVSAANTFEERDIDLLFVGRVLRQKGIFDFFHAAAMADGSKWHPGKRIVVAGDGGDIDAAKELANHLKLPVDFLGIQTATQIDALMRRARILCCPSKTGHDGWQEAFGLVFAEASARGTPSVATLHGGISESCPDNVSGLLVPEGDVPAMASSIVNIHTNRLLWNRLSVQGMEYCRRNFDLQRQSAILESHYSSIVHQC